MNTVSKLILSSIIILMVTTSLVVTFFSSDSKNLAANELRASSFSNYSMSHCLNEKCVQLSGPKAKQALLNPMLVSLKQAQLELIDIQTGVSEKLNLKYANFDMRSELISGTEINTNREILVDTRNLNKLTY